MPFSARVLALPHQLCLLHCPPQTNDTFNRAAAYPNFELHTGSEWQALEPTGDGKQVCCGLWWCGLPLCEYDALLMLLPLLPQWARR